MSDPFAGMIRKRTPSQDADPAEAMRRLEEAQARAKGSHPPTASPDPSRRPSPTSTPDFGAPQQHHDRVGDLPGHGAAERGPRTKRAEAVRARAVPAAEVFSSSRDEVLLECEQEEQEPRRRTGPTRGRRQLKKGAGAAFAISFRCDQATHDKLEALAERWGCSLNSALVRVVDEHGREIDRLRELLQTVARAL